MLFTYFSKQATVKISVYKLASVCYSCFQTKTNKVIIKLIDFLPLQDYTADGNTRKQNCQCMSTALQNMNSNQKLLLYKKLLKAKLITSSSFVTFSAKIRTTSNQLYNILRLFNVLLNLPFNRRETMSDYYLCTWYI